MSHAEALPIRRSPCPTCGQAVVRRGNPARPFCSVTCKLVDLGRWLDEAYRVPGPPVPAEADRAELARAESDASD